MPLNLLEKKQAEDRKKLLEERGVTLDKLKKDINSAATKEPTKEELAYEIQLSKLQKSINKEIKRNIDTIVEEGATNDKLDFFLTVTLAAIVTDFASRITLFNDTLYDNTLYNTLGINNIPSNITKEMSASWIKENVDLIKGVNQRQVSQIQASMLRATRTGASTKDLQSELNKIFKSGRNNVSFIARDQVSKFNGQIDRVKQMEIGVKQYTWITRGDDRVRPEHAAREGMTFDWDNAPSGGHPAQAPGCRCKAKPILDSIIGVKTT